MNAPVAPAKEFFRGRKEAAAYLTSIGCPIAASSMNKLAEFDNKKRGPPYNKFRGRAIYKRSDLDVWAEQQTKRVR